MQHQISQISSFAHDHRQQRRRQVEDLLTLAEYLPPKDRVLIEHVLGQGLSVTRIAKLYQRPPKAAPATGYNHH